MPMKLANVPMKKLPIFVDKFPKAVSLSFNPAFEWDEEVAAAIQSLTRLKYLEAMKLDNFTHVMRNREVMLFFTLMGKVLGSCHQLRSLSVGSLFNAKAEMLLYSHLSHLTGLTHLDLRSGWEQLVDDPYTEVRNIKDLAIQSVCLQNGQLVFPSLTQLTRLSMCWNVRAAEKFKGGVLQMILPYASSLQSLKIYGSYIRETETDWALLREFRQLAWIDFIFLHFELAQDFCAALDCLNLTHLGFSWGSIPADFAERMAGVTSLVSLRSLSFNSFSEDVYKMFATMTQLTSLRMNVLSNIEPLTALTALRDLEFSPRAEALSNLSHAFSHLQNLESLVMRSDYNIRVLSSCFSHLKNLRSLSLEALASDGDIFRTLAQLSGLTKLTLSGCRCLLFSALSGINALTNLIELELLETWWRAVQMSVLMEGKLLKLRYLTLTSNNRDSYERQSLLQSLPDLRQCYF